MHELCWKNDNGKEHTAILLKKCDYKLSFSSPKGFCFLEIEWSGLNRKHGFGISNQLVTQIS